MKPPVYLFQLSYQYGKEIYLPYSVGMLWAYARTIPEIAQHYGRAELVFLRDQPERLVAAMERPSVAAFSTYVWNWEISAAVARLVKERFPDCLIVFGGPQVPNRIDGFFDQYPFIDLAVHGEGEITFAEILKARASGGHYGEICGLSHRGGTTPPRPRARDLDAFPSPYLTGVFDELLAQPYEFQAVWETNRGCPYACTFCDWGSMIAQKLSVFDEQRLYREMDFFGARKIRYVYGGDANFGILERDVRLAAYLAETKARSGGYPDKFRVNFTKNSSERVRDIAKILSERRLEKGITLSVQSLDQTTLKTIKRRNLEFDSLAGFIKQYRRDGIPTYTEVIVGLPGETYETFKQGIDALLEAGAHDSVWIYRCTVLPNAEMNDPLYRRAHGIRVKRTPIFLNHSTPGADPVQEYEDTIVETAALSAADYKRALVLAWAIQAFHALGLTQAIAIHARLEAGLAYTAFYERLIALAAAQPDSLLGRELRATRDKIDDVLDRGASWDIVVDGFSKLTWAMEEATFLRLSVALERFYAELEPLIATLGFSPELRRDVIKYQRAIIVQPLHSGAQRLELGHAMHRFHQAALRGEPEALERGRFAVTVEERQSFGGNREEFAVKVLFWGRRGGQLMYSVKEQALL